MHEVDISKAPSFFSSKTRLQYHGKVAVLISIKKNRINFCTFFTTQQTNKNIF